MAETPDKPLGRESTAELLSEATSLLKTLRSMKVLRVKELKPVGTDGLAPVGLLDGGATNGLRRAHQQELEKMYPVRVELASGSTTLFRVDDHKTLLSKDHVEVIVPLHRLVGLGYRLQWTAAGVKINQIMAGLTARFVEDVRFYLKPRRWNCSASWRRQIGGRSSLMMKFDHGGHRDSLRSLQRCGSS